MNELHAILIGLVEGISEYLPVSANGHVIITGSLLGDPADLVKSLGVALQAAPMLAVLLLYHRRFEAMFAPSRAGETTFKGRHAWALFLAGVLPVLISGFLFKRYFYGLMLSPWPSVTGLALGGVGILIAEYTHHEERGVGMDGLTLAQALGIGLFQCLALWPGVSRSGATIIGGLVLGLNRRAAAEFSFLIGVPVFAAAAGLELWKSAPLHQNWLPFALAFAVSFCCANVTVKLFMRLLGRMSFKPFGWYRIAISPLLWYLFR
jgi:undecaprenyl-diphosphatase